MKLKFWVVLALLVVAAIGAGFVCYKFYPYIFAKTIKGELTGVERVNTQQVIASKSSTAEQMFSFAIAIRDEKGEIHTASSEDRQWAVAKAGQCAEVRIFPYPFWELDKANTFFGARLERLYDCPAK